jgi:hypothetical protein
MSRWTSITIDDLNDRKLAPYVDALRTAALANGQFDPSEQIITDAVAQIRSEIGSWPRNILDSDATKIPSDLKGLAVRMVLRDMKGRLEEALTEDERREKQSDENLLERIAAGKRAIAEPDDPQTTPEIQHKGGVEVVTKGSVQTTREQMNGL